MANTIKSQYTPRQFTKALREAIDPEEFGLLVKDLMEIVREKGDQYSLNDKLNVVSMLAAHLKGRPKAEPHTCEPISLGYVNDEATALEAMNRIIQAVSEGSISKESAEIYVAMVEKAQRIGAGGDGTEQLKDGGAPEFFMDADAEPEEIGAAFAEHLKNRISSN